MEQNNIPKKERQIYPTLGSKTAKWKIDYLIHNAKTRTARQISEATGMSQCFIYDYCKLKNIELLKVIKKAHKHKSVESLQNGDRSRPILRFQMTEKKGPLVRPPAIYGNRSQAEIIEYYLNLDI